MKLDIQVPHESHLQLWERDDWRYAIFMGGRGNGRSGTASRFSLTSLLGEDYCRGAFMRAVHAAIKDSSWGELQDRIFENDLESVDGFKMLDKHLEYGQNSLRSFGFRASSGSLTARLKSLADFNYAWIEEMEEIGKNEFRQFDNSLRTKKGPIRIVGTTNPPPKNHWIIEDFFDLEPAEEVHGPDAKGFYVPHLKESRTDTIFIGGTYKENQQNLDERTVEMYERFKETDPDYYWHQIMGLVPETVQGRIYTGWKEIDSIPHEARLLGHFIDFGGASSEDAIGTVYYYNGGYIIDERYYKTDNGYDTLIQVCKMLEPGPIIADSAEDRMIKALREAGVNITGAQKGPGSVDFGIKLVQGLKVSYTKASANLKREYENYAWLFDKDGNNKARPDPNCKHKYGDHLLDGFRYFATEIITAGADPEADKREAMRIEVKQQERSQNVSKRLGL